MIRGAPVVPGLREFLHLFRKLGGEIVRFDAVRQKVVEFPRFVIESEEEMIARGQGMDTEVGTSGPGLSHDANEGRSVALGGGGEIRIVFGFILGRVIFGQRVHAS